MHFLNYMISNNFDMYIKISYFYNFVFKIIGEMGIVAGWGRLSEGGQLPSILQYVSSYWINYLKKIIVDSSFQSMFLKLFIQYSHFVLEKPFN